MAEPIPFSSDPGTLPSEGQRTAASYGPREAKEIADEAVDFYERGSRAKRLRDLTAEKYALHLDGSGGSQWYDLYYGTRMKMVPQLKTAPRLQNNQLRPIIDNVVAHLTTQDYRYVVESRKDKESRERALIDQLIVNYHCRKQRWNTLWIEAKYTAAVYGFCPVHQMVRQDLVSDPYEAVLAARPNGQPMQGPRRVQLDAFVGNPWGMVFDAGAKRGSVHRCVWERVLPADLVRQAFSMEIEGDEHTPSASQFQRIAQRWLTQSFMVHGTPALHAGRGNTELVALLYDEIPPGILPDWPDGRLCIIGMAGASSADVEGGVKKGRAKLLWCDKLPGASYSFVRVYSHQRMDDVLGKPFIEDLDEDQIQLNQLESMANEFLRRANKPPLASSGNVDVKSLGYEGDTVFEVEPLAAGELELRYLEYPARHIPLLERKIERVLQGMYRKGAYQAASRGELPSGASGKALIASQAADDSILGPIVSRTKAELEDFAGLGWRLLKEFLDVPLVIDSVGNQFGYLAPSYVDRTMMSEREPTFSLVSSWGTSVEAKAQQLLNLYGMRDAAGEQVLSTRELKLAWPDRSMWGDFEDPREYRERKAKSINKMIQQAGEQVRLQMPQLAMAMSDPMLQMVAQQLAMQIDQVEPVLMDDDLELNIELLSLLTQDTSEDPLVRQTARVRQLILFEWLARKQAAMQQQSVAVQQAQAQGQNKDKARASAISGGKPQLQNPAREGNTNTAEGMVQADKNFEQRIA